MLPNCRKCSMLRENVHANRTNPFEMFHIIGVRRCWWWWWVRCCDMSVKVHLVCIVPQFALYHDGLAMPFYVGIRQHRSLALKCILTNTFLNCSSTSSWTQRKCSLNVAHYITTQTIFESRVLLYRCCSHPKKEKKNLETLNDIPIVIEFCDL